MPHNESSGDDILILKLSSGYNIGINAEGYHIEVLDAVEKASREPSNPVVTEGLPNISLLSTGGTIASFVDYRTGAVHPALSASDLVGAVPELSGIANISAKVLFSIFSENMRVEHWQALARNVMEEIGNGADAIIIPHGTDTMGYTASALSYMLGELDVPVVLVGAQRSSDRPSSDAASNLIAAVRFCVDGGMSGVFVIMHDSLEDNSFAAHVGTRVRKMHTSRRDAFKSINCEAATHIDESGRMTGKGGNLANPFPPSTLMNASVAFIQYHPGYDERLLEHILSTYDGIVIAGTGLGHVSQDVIPLIREACDKGKIVAMTSQCIGGRTNLNVYGTGRDMLNAGVIALLDMLPETAYVKLMWALGMSKDVNDAKAVMMTPVSNDMGDRREAR